MKAVIRRLHRLEERYQTELSGKPKEHLRLIVTRAEKMADLATSTCTRHLSGGALTEMVWLDGLRDHLSDEDIENFVQSFPIETDGDGHYRGAASHGGRR